MAARARDSTMAGAVQLTISKENYLKAIAEAEAEGETVIAATLVRWLQVTPAAVTMALRRLQRDGLLRVGQDGRLRLTPAGREIAHRVLQRHYLIERMLVEIFGMEWYKVHDEAERLEHAVSEEFERKLLERLGTEGACPHGNRVTGDTPRDRRAQGWMNLEELEPDAHTTVMSVHERERGLLDLFDHLGIRPSARLVLRERNSDETLTLEVDGRRVPLGRSAADKVWVSAG